MSTFPVVVALSLGLALLASGRPKKCMTSLEGYTWEYKQIVDEVIIGVETLDLCIKICADDTECRGYTWTNAGVVELCYKFKHQLQGYHECVACTSGVPSQSVDGACVGDEFLDIAPANKETKPDQCEEYMFLVDFDRSVEYNNGGCIDDDDYNTCHCDKIGPFQTSYDWLGPGYYRMMSNAGSRLPESSPGTYYCGALGSGWQAGEHHQDVFEEKNMTACFDAFAAGGPCYYRVDITVTNCDGFYVYMLPDAPACNLRYCASN